MGKIVISENVSLDGVVQDPTGEAGFKHGGWFEQFMGEDREAWAKVEFAEARPRRLAGVGQRRRSKEPGCPRAVGQGSGCSQEVTCGSGLACILRWWMGI